MRALGPRNLLRTFLWHDRLLVVHFVPDALQPFGVSVIAPNAHVERLRSCERESEAIDEWFRLHKTRAPYVGVRYVDPTTVVGHGETVADGTQWTTSIEGDLLFYVWERPVYSAFAHAHVKHTSAAMANRSFEALVESGVRR